MKYLPYILLFLLTTTSIIFGWLYLNELDTTEQQNTYQRQLEGDLTTKETQLQQLNQELSLSRSKLVTQDELNKTLTNTTKEFEAFKKNHNLVISSKDHTIAKLTDQLKGGYTKTEHNEDTNTYSYTYTDPYNRFKLQDPDILTPNNETFTQTQYFLITGEIYQQSNGLLKTKRLILQEAVKNDDKYIPISTNISIIDSNFTYIPTIPAENIPEFTITDIFTLRPIIGSSIEVYPHTLNLRLNTGMEVMNFYGVGLGSYTSIDFNDIMYTSQHLYLSYSPVVNNKQLNFGISISIGYSLSQDIVADTGLIFYIW